MAQQVNKVEAIVPVEIIGPGVDSYTTVGLDVSVGGDITIRLTHYDLATRILDLIQSNSLNSLDLRVKGEF